MKQKMEMTRFEWIMSQLKDNDEKQSLKDERDHFLKLSDEALSQGSSPETAVVWTLAQLNEKYVRTPFEHVSRELACAFAWSLSAHGDDYWIKVYVKYDRLRQVH